MSRPAAGHLCPVCVRPAARGTCAAHGTWRPHQLLSRRDRRRSERERWQPFAPQTQACPRCLGEVTEGRSGFACVEHGHDHDAHGPFRVDELLAPTAQRESAMARHRLARRNESRRRDPFPVSIRLPEPAHGARMLFSVTIVAATLAFLTR